jgi:dolichyl-phosphate beta-glucosyltransferase
MSPADNSNPECTLILPTYNAEAFIGQTVARIRRFVREHPAFEVLFVCDGCRDNTVALLQSLLAEDNNRIRVLAYEQNRGKGFALRTAFSACETPYMIFTDVDLAYEPDDAEKLLAVLKSGADLVVVNRASPDSTYLISPRDFSNIYKRHLMSRAYNRWLRMMLPIDILDTQAGYKGLSAAAWARLGPRLQCNGFFFDTELLAHAGAMGLDVRQTPAHFRYLDPTTVRMVKSGWSMLGDTLALRRRLRAQYGRLTGNYAVPNATLPPAVPIPTDK